MRNLSVIPQPKSCKITSDNILRVKHAIYSDNSDWLKYAEVFCGYCEKMYDSKPKICSGGVELIEDKSISNSGYVIDTSDGIKLCAACDEGICYALSTLIQIVEEDRQTGEFLIPDMHIEDEPDKDYRGFMVDLARCFHPFETVLSYLDICFMYKIKYVHLHFIDNEFYMLPSEIMPKLPTAGRHYTTNEIEILNKYANDRGLIIVPEFEVPGHARAMNNAYPEIFANASGQTDVSVMHTETGIAITGADVICAGSEKAMDGVKSLIREITDMFPHSPYIHIGGDEVNTAVWNTCPHCIDYMKNNDISDNSELYCDFVARVSQFVIDEGRTPIVWEGFPERGVHKIPKETIVIAWESHYLTADKLLENGFRIINSSWQPLYIVPSLTECWGAKDILNWNVYNWKHWWEKSKATLNPINVAPTDMVLGAQLCTWEQSYEMEISKVVENLAALAERCWNLKRKADDSQIFNDIRLLKKRLGRIITR